MSEEEIAQYQQQAGFATPDVQSEMYRTGGPTAIAGVDTDTIRNTNPLKQDTSILGFQKDPGSSATKSPLIDQMIDLGVIEKERWEEEAPFYEEHGLIANAVRNRGAGGRGRAVTAHEGRHAVGEYLQKNSLHSKLSVGSKRTDLYENYAKFATGIASASSRERETLQAVFELWYAPAQPTKEAQVQAIIASLNSPALFKGGERKVAIDEWQQELRDKALSIAKMEASVSVIQSFRPQIESGELGLDSEEVQKAYDAAVDHYFNKGLERVEKLGPLIEEAKG